MKRSIRVLALLMAVLLVALPPLQARAAIGTGTAVMIGLGAAAVVGSVMAGLGVMPGSDRSVFDGLVDDCIASDEVSKFLNPDGTISVLRYATLNGEKRIGTLKNLIEAVFGWIWKSKTVEGSSPSTYINCVFDKASYSVWSKTDIPLVVRCVYYLDTSHTPTSSYPCRYICHFYAFSDSPGSVYFNSSSNSLYNYGSLYAASAGYTYVYNSPPSFSGMPNLYLGEHHSFADLDSVFSGLSFSDVLMYSSEDIVLGAVAANGSDLTSSYADWSAGSIALPHPGIDIPGVDEGTDEGTGDDTEEGEEEGEQEKDRPLIYWPTGTAGSLADIGSDAATGALTQEGVISGVGTVDDTLIDAIPGIKVDGITGDIATTVPGEGTEEGEGSVEDEIVYPTDIPSYTLDLRNIFPFCIPFDIYKFLSILAADPEAPVFHWKIPVPQLGAEYEVEVDLSPWDNVAKLFRMLELLAFIVGLAMLTRDKFIRS